MATTKIREIHQTLGKAISYICNPDKTKGMLLVDSFRCSPETAVAQMELTASYGTGLGNRKAYHLIQSFDPDDDLTPEKALEIGKQYADLVTGRKYEYVIATHNDRKHLHNHIIFNAVSFEDYRKYHHANEDVKRIRDLSDQLCRENNLSVIERTSGRKGKKHEEYKSGGSWRDRLADMIDKAILGAQSYDDFLEKMELEGVTVKKGNHISFKCELLGQERACRGKTIGPGYTEEAIRARIERNEKFLSDNSMKSPEQLDTWVRMKKRRNIPSQPQMENDEKPHTLIDAQASMESGRGLAYMNELGKNNIGNTGEAIRVRVDSVKPPEQLDSWERMKKRKKNPSQSQIKNDEKIRTLIDVQASMEAGKSLAYMNKLEKINIGNFVRFTNFMQDHNLLGLDDLMTYEKNQRAQGRVLQNKLDSKIQQRKIQQKKYECVRNYVRYKRTYIEYRRGGSQADFRKRHQEEIEGYLKAEAYLKSMDIVKPDGRMLKEILENELMPLNQEINELRRMIEQHKKDLKNTVTIRWIYVQTYGISLLEDESELLEFLKLSLDTDLEAGKSQKQESVQR